MNESDGSEVTSAGLIPDLSSERFVAMSEDKTFHFYSWQDITGDDLMTAPDGVPAAD